MRIRILARERLPIIVKDAADQLYRSQYTARESAKFSRVGLSFKTFSELTCLLTLTSINRYQI